MSCFGVACGCEDEDDGGCEGNDNGHPGTPFVGWLISTTLLNKSGLASAHICAVTAPKS